MSWVRKYSPKTGKEIIGQDKQVSYIADYINNYKKKKKKALLIYGPSGIGKTSSAYAVANDLNLEIFEINASDTRNKEEIEVKLGNVINQRSLFSKGKIILVDEVDGLSGKEDRGGIQALAKLIQKTSFPIILTAINPWDYKFSSLRSKCELLQFNELNYLDVYEFLKKICNKENIDYDNIALKSLARRQVDLRAAINDLQMLTNDGKLTKEDLNELGDRNKSESMMNALIKIFKNSDPIIARDAFENVDEDLDKQILWIDENLAKEYKGKDLALAYDKLSKADVFRRRIRRWQHWRFLVYINALITSGIAVSKEKKYKEMVKYAPTTRLLKLYWANIRYMKRKSIAEKIAETTHSSIKDAVKDVPYFQLIFKKNKIMAESISDELDLNNEEVEWLKK